MTAHFKCPMCNYTAINKRDLEEHVTERIFKELEQE
jgi:hypothetical protein